MATTDGHWLRPGHVLSELAANWNDRAWWRSRVYQRVNRPIQHALQPPSAAADVLEEDWDALIVLDACRADLFAEVVDGDLSERSERHTTVCSPASATQEWLRRTFDDAHGDIVYVAGNPQVSRHRPEAFHRLIESWRRGHDPETSVIDPATVTADAIDAAAEYPAKRLIVHYMQPHCPFIGHPDLNYADWDFADVGLSGQDREAINSVWDALAAGLVDREAVWDGYRDNLRAVLDEVEALLAELEGRVVVTSDHGNMLGGRSWPVPIRTYSHPDNLRHTGLIEVPWVEVEGAAQPVSDGGAASASAATEEEVQERLRGLGYV